MVFSGFRVQQEMMANQDRLVPLGPEVHLVQWVFQDQKASLSVFVYFVTKSQYSSKMMIDMTIAIVIHCRGTLERPARLEAWELQVKGQVLVFYIYCKHECFFMIITNSYTVSCRE